MNLNQMAFRCPDAQVVDTVRLEGYRLAFRMNGGGHGVATILPEPDSFVDGVLWRISERGMSRAWIFMRDSPGCTERSLSLW